jgi:two-component system sensor histidine kinase UhpB
MPLSRSPDAARRAAPARVQEDRLSLFARVLIANVLVFGVAALVLILSPATISASVTGREVLELAIGLAIALLVNLAILRPAFRPLERLADSMRTADLLRPGERVRVSGRGEVADLVRAFNQMLDRLEAERRQSAGRTLLAQEDERRRIAQELHDEVGQTLTAVLLQLGQAARHAPTAVAGELREAQETTRQGLDDVRRIVAMLRPEALELGLPSALTALCTGVADRTGARVRRTIEPGLPALGPDVELVVYRVAQEALTNVARHAGASEVDVRLAHGRQGVELVVADDGRGLAGSGGGEGGAGGIRGMRERALQVGGRLSVEEPPGGGVVVRLLVPSA